MQQTIDRLSRELNLPADVVVKSYKAYWLFIRQTIEELPLKEDMNEETFSRLRTNFNKKKHKVIQEKYAKHNKD